jgi:hypothetical protein
MPIYTMQNKKTGEIEDMLLSISQMQELVNEGEWEQIIGAPSLVTHVGNIVNKTSGDWKNHLDKIKKGSSRYIKNTINT